MSALSPRERRLLSVYGISQEEFDALLAFQGGRCALCLRVPEPEGGGWVVDHDHATKQIRGILCRYCNHQVVGRHRVGLNSVYLLRRAAEYLELPPALRFGLGTVPVKKKRRKKSARVAAMRMRRAA